MLDIFLPAEGLPAAAAVVGTGGMGKSHLLEELAQSCEASGQPVYRVRGHRLEQGQPNGSIDDLFDSLQILRPSDERLARQLLLDKLGNDRALLLVDDAQWIDRESLRMLVGVAERAAERGIGLVVAHRPADGEELAALDAVLSQSRPLLQLGPLPPSEVGARVASMLGCTMEAGVIDALMARTEGVPLYVDRVVRAWTEAGVISNGALARDPGELPAVGAQLVVTKLAQLEPAARLIVTGLTVGTTLDDELLGALFGLSVAELKSAVTDLRNAGLMSPSRPVLLPLVGEAVDALTPLLTQRDLHLRLARILVERGTPAPAVAEHLVAAEARGEEVANLLIQAGDHSLADAPELALEWYGEAVAAGADPMLLAARRAEAAALSGALDEALVRADQVLGAPASDGKERALAVLAGVLPSRGLWRRSADIYETLARTDLGAPAFYAVVGLIGAGEPERARSIWQVASEALGGAATLLTEVAALVARACLETVGDAPLESIGLFLEAAELLEAGQFSSVLPDTPHALGALAAIAAQDFSVAEHLLERAIAASAGGSAYSARHRLLLGWVGLRTGRWAMAQSALDSTARMSSDLSLRDQLTASALGVGLARRRSDADGLVAAGSRASLVLRRHPADLYSAEFVGELCCAGGQAGIAEGRAAEVEQICARLGSPTLWLVPARWHAFQAAAAAEDTAAAMDRARSLASLEGASAGAVALVNAGSVWGESLAGGVNAERVRAAVAALQKTGLGWEASRLAGSAASRVADATLGRSLLEKARDLTAALPTLDSGAAASFSALSEREGQVAALVVGGLTHKEIGAQLFISPKTVEHHVARIRQRLGAGSRAELLKELRSILG